MSGVRPPPQPSCAPTSRTVRTRAQVFLTTYYSVWDVEQKRIGFAKSVLDPPEHDMHLWQEKGPAVHAGIRLEQEAGRLANAAVIDHNSVKIGDWHAANGKIDPSTIMIDPSRA